MLTVDDIGKKQFGQLVKSQKKAQIQQGAINNINFKFVRVVFG